MDIAITIVAAVIAGMCFALAGVLQQRVASTRPEGESLSPRLLLDLARQRLWVAGISMAMLSYVFQAIALAFGPLSVVQPLIVTELVFALPVSARLHDMRLSLRDWGGVFAVGGGLAVAIVAADPSEGQPAGSNTGWLLLLGAVVVIAGVAVLVARRLGGTPSASLYALAGATVMGSQSALLDVTIVHLRSGAGVLFTSWQTYLLVVASIVGLLLIQSAYQAGPLAASMPVIDAVEPLVAIGIGVTLFGEAIAAGLLRRGIAGAGLLLLLGGIALLDTSPVIKRIHQQESEQDAGEDEQVHLRA